MLFDPEQNETEFTKFWSSIADEVGYAFVRPQWIHILMHSPGK